MTSAHDKYEQLIDGMLLDELPPPAWHELRAHLSGCADCRARYDRVALAERMLHGGPAALAAPSPSAFARIEAAVLAEATPAPAPVWKRALRWLAPPRRWGVALGAARTT
jgi:anti-sigma factor RsiW